MKEIEYTANNGEKITIAELRKLLNDLDEGYDDYYIRFKHDSYESGWGWSSYWNAFPRFYANEKDGVFFNLKSGLSSSY